MGSSPSNYDDVGTGDDSTSVRGSSVLNHGRQQRRDVLRQTSSTNRRRLSRQTATKGVMYSFTLLVAYLPVFGVLYFPHNQMVHMTASLFSNIFVSLSLIKHSTLTRRPRLRSLGKRSLDLESQCDSTMPGIFVGIGTPAFHPLSSVGALVVRGVLCLLSSPVCGS